MPSKPRTTSPSQRKAKARAEYKTGPEKGGKWASKQWQHRGGPKRLSTQHVKQIRECQAKNLPYYHPVQRCYKIGTRALIGANAWLRDTLYPYFSYAKATELALTMHTSASGGCAKRERGGLFRGSLVDKQITLWARSGGRYLPPARHRFALRVMAAFRSWGWTPLSAQIVVTDGRLATALDIKVKDRDGHVWAIELKTGMQHTFELAQGYLNEPLAFVPNSPHSHAMLQLAMGLALHDSPHCTSGYVVRVDSEGVHRYALESWAVKAIPRLVATSVV